MTLLNARLVSGRLAGTLTLTLVTLDGAASLLWLLLRQIQSKWPRANNRSADGLIAGVFSPHGSERARRGAAAEVNSGWKLRHPAGTRIQEVLPPEQAPRSLQTFQQSEQQDNFQKQLTKQQKRALRLDTLSSATAAGMTNAICTKFHFPAALAEEAGPDTR